MPKLKPRPTPKASVDGTPPGAYVLMRGPRLRIGISAGGITLPTHRVYNRAAGRYEYTGATVDEARAAVHACPGGVVFLTEGAYRQLSVQHLPKDITVVNMGE
jgi:class 3 adenylate cyclase